MKYLDLAMNLAKDLGADYADIRIQNTLTERIFLENVSFKENGLSNIYGYGIRIL